MSHDLHDKYTVVGCGCGVNTVNTVRGNVDGALKAEGDICAVNIIVDGLGKMNDI